MSDATLYGVATLGRFGLGHRLLAWARCVIWCHQSGAQMLAPNWLGFPIGTWLRREPDKRMYFPLFRSDAYIHGWRRLHVLTSARHVEALTLETAVSSQKSSRVVVFRNAMYGDADRFFPTFLGHHELLLHELKRMTRPQFIPPSPATSHVAIHVRLGDFVRVTADQAKAGTHSVRLPIDWYGSVLVGIRERLGISVPALVYSDGTDSDLQPLLSLPNVVRAAQGTAITHMLAMSQASLLIGSGSGMSLWGSFLGQVPRLCFPGQRLLRCFVADGWEPECEFGHDIPATFVDSIRPRFDRAR